MVSPQVLLAYLRRDLDLCHHSRDNLLRDSAPGRLLIEVDFVTLRCRAALRRQERACRVCLGSRRSVRR